MDVSTGMKYLDLNKFVQIRTETFQARTPFPWVNPQNLITDSGYEHLLHNLPDPGLFIESFGKPRAHGQKSHDRLTLEYNDELPIAAPWKEFIGELRGPDYRNLLHRLIGTRTFTLKFHWHYTPRGCAISPHCDAEHKLASHIFYMNTEQDWKPTWGGQTLLLDDNGEFPRESAPQIKDFDNIIRSKAIGNSSLLFSRRERSWHGMLPLTCPEGNFRKVFIVVINRRLTVKTRLETLWSRATHTFHGKET